MLLSGALLLSFAPLSGCREAAEFHHELEERVKERANEDAKRMGGMLITGIRCPESAEKKAGTAVICSATNAEMNLAVKVEVAILDKEGNFSYRLGGGD